MESKVDLIVEVCTKCASILLDPTNGGKVELSAEARAKSREEAHDNLLVAVDTLAAMASSSEGYFEVVNIAKKLSIGDEKK